ncbi:MAG TPA: hypothetical protein VHL14_15910 [Steroidobacteraceae bacterium]|nr:hypothetical protein [Steroidobacteraceae bacterium]
MKLKKLMFGAVVLMMVSSVCAARDVEDSDFSDHSDSSSGNSGLGFVVSGAAEFGGDSIDSVNYTDGSSQPIKAGQGVTLSIGGHYRFSSIPLDIMTTVGYKYVTTKASNANIYIGRVVPAIEVSYWFTDSWWVGAGPVWHMNNELRGGQFIANRKFDPALGVNLQAGWRFVALTYTNIKYTDSVTKQKFGANNFGLALIGRF